MSFDVHPILEPGQRPTKATWYVIAPEDSSTQLGALTTDTTGPGGPGPRVGACANFLQLGGSTGSVLVSAGATPDGPYSDLYQLSLEKDKMEWISLPSVGLPARYEHTSFVSSGDTPSKDGARDSLYVFAGAKPEGPVSDMWKYNFEDKLWMSVNMSGPIPIPRTYHSSSSVSGDGKSLVVYSGGDAGMSPVTDQETHLFDLESGKWRTLATSGSPPPSPRQGHVSTVVNSKLYIHGGMAGQEIFSDVHCLDLGTLKWSCLKVGGDAPPPLAAHGCAVIDSDIFIFGGLSPAGPGAQDTLYCLNTDLLVWTKLSTYGPPPPARLDHAMCSIRLPVVSQTEATREGDLGKARDGGGDKEVESAQGSFQALTLIDSENVAKSSFSVSKSASACDEKLERELKCLSVEDEGAGRSKGHRAEGKDGCQWVSALFVFGGIDTAGNIHSDSFILVPL